ncbi:potassium channel subfamily K member 18-like, partial [Brachionus plicatilis]
ITVPISITLFVLSNYILLGGIFFKTLEEWTVIEGVYFCFITLSTIGLGDYVPGNSINDSDTQAELKLVGCSLYLLIGLSLLVMCFNLMQEEVTAKFKKLAVRLGIIDDPNYCIIFIWFLTILVSVSRLINVLVYLSKKDQKNGILI